MSDLILKKLSLRLLTLLCLNSNGKQMQIMHLISLEDIKYAEEQVFIPVMQQIKQSKTDTSIYL